MQIEELDNLHENSMCRPLTNLRYFFVFYQHVFIIFISTRWFTTMCCKYVHYNNNNNLGIKIHSTICVSACTIFSLQHCFFLFLQYNANNLDPDNISLYKFPSHMNIFDLSYMKESHTLMYHSLHYRSSNIRINNYP